MEFRGNIDLAGPEASGKTELCIHAAITCILPSKWKEVLQINGCHSSVIYIDTDCKFSLIRFASVLQERIQYRLKDTQVTSTEISDIMEDSLSRFFIIRCHSSTQLFSTLHSLLETLKNGESIRLLVIDSITAFHLTERFGSADAAAAFYSSIIELLRRFQSLSVLSTRHQLIANGKHDSFLSKDWTSFSARRYITEYNPDIRTHFLKPSLPSASSAFAFRVDDSGVSFLG